jgi:hypothetical protein
MKFRNNLQCLPKHRYHITVKLYSVALNVTTRYCENFQDGGQKLALFSTMLALMSRLPEEIISNFVTTKYLIK